MLAGAAAGWYAAAIALVSESFRYGHLAAVVLASLLGAVATVTRGASRLPRIGRRGRSAGSRAVLVLAIAFDVPEFSRQLRRLLRRLGAARRLSGRARRRVCLPGPLPAAGQAVDSRRGRRRRAPRELRGDRDAGAEPLDDQSAWIGVRELVPALVFALLAASVFRIERHRSLATVMWSLAVTALVWSELLLVPDNAWRAVAVGITGLALGLLARPLAEQRLWFAGWGLTVATGAVVVMVCAVDWALFGVPSAHASIAALGVAGMLAAVAAIEWRTTRLRDLVTVAWSLAIILLLFGEAFLLHGGPATGLAAAATGAVVALLAKPLAEKRLWWAATVVVTATSGAVFVLLTPPDHFFSPLRIRRRPLGRVRVLAAGVVLRVTSGVESRRWIDPVVAIGALYLLSLGILEVAQQVFGGSIESDFERGHVGVSVVWALIGLALLVAGLLRDSSLLRYGGLALFGLSLAKIFLFDLSALSSVARALSFIAVGGLVLAGGFFLQKLTTASRQSV